MFNAGLYAASFLGTAGVFFVAICLLQILIMNTAGDVRAAAKAKEASDKAEEEVELEEMQMQQQQGGTEGALESPVGIVEVEVNADALAVSDRAQEEGTPDAGVNVDDMASQIRRKPSVPPLRGERAASDK